LLGAIEERERSIRQSVEQAEQGRREAERLLEEHRGLVAQARKERAEAREQGRSDAEALKGEIMQEAARQRDRLLEQTQVEVQAGLRQARAELRETAADLAILAAEKLLVKNLDDPTQRKLVESYLSELERSAGGSGSLPA
jgi:F-type H+-transporting ATPase subunit b